MHNLKPGWIILAMLIVVSLATALSIWEISRTLDAALSPIQELTGNLSTKVAVALSPTPTVLPDPVTIIHEVRSLARLETIQFSIEKIITAEVNQGVLAPLIGDRLLLIAHGYVIAGIDLGKLRPEDLEVKNGVLYVHLPEAEIFVATLDNEKTYIYDRDTGLLTKGNINLETAARRVAEIEIEKAAREDGILELAKHNAASYLSLLFQELGFHEVIFLETEPTPTP